MPHGETRRCGINPELNLFIYLCPKLLFALRYCFLIVAFNINDQFHFLFHRFVQLLRILRIARIFKMARHSVGLQTLAYTFKHSSAELGLLLLLLLMGMTLFSSLVYFAEETNSSSHFKSIPEGFWWAIITMTTVGYGDMYPTTSIGKLIGCICCTSGIIFIALPIPTIVGNFSQFYKDQRKNAEVLRRVEDGEVLNDELEIGAHRTLDLESGASRKGS